MSEAVGLDRSSLVDRLVDLLMEGDRHPRRFLGLMEDVEVERGGVLVPIGSTEPFAVPEADWNAAVISVRDGRARIALVDARLPARGSFRRLVVGIQAARLTPVVVEPTGLVMPEIMRRWRWKRRVRGSGWERAEEWSPAATKRRVP